MTTVQVDISKLDGVTDVPASGTLWVSPLRPVVGESIVTTEPFPVNLVNGIASFAVPPSGAENAYLIRPEGLVGLPLWAVQIPDVPTITLAALVTLYRVAIETLAPNPSAPAAWVSAIAAAVAGLTGPDGSWRELARHTLTAPGTELNVANLPECKYLRLVVFVKSTGGTTGVTVRFNGDAGNNYAQRESSNGSADSSSVNAAGITLTGAATYDGLFAAMQLVNVATSDTFGALEFRTGGPGGLGTAPSRLELNAKWSKAELINAVSVLRLTGTGQYAIGSELIVFGHN